MELPSRNTSIRVQRTSYDRASIPESPTTSRTSRRMRRLSIASAKIPSPVCSSSLKGNDPSRSCRLNAINPIQMFITAAARSELLMPIHPSNTKPARKHPVIAPNVLVEYSEPIPSPRCSIRRTTTLDRTGRVAPIIVVGTINMAVLRTNRAMLIQYGDEPISL